METRKNYEAFQPSLEEEKDCPRCSQVLGSNPDCDTCSAAAGWSTEERKKLISEKRAKDKKFGFGKKFPKH